MRKAYTLWECGSVRSVWGKIKLLCEHNQAILGVQRKPPLVQWYPEMKWPSLVRAVLLFKDFTSVRDITTLRSFKKPYAILCYYGGHLNSARTQFGRQVESNTVLPCSL